MYSVLKEGLIPAFTSISCSSFHYHIPGADLVIFYLLWCNSFSSNPPISRLIFSNWSFTPGTEIMFLRGTFDYFISLLSITPMGLGPRSFVWHVWGLSWRGPVIVYSHLAFRQLLAGLGSRHTELLIASWTFPFSSPVYSWPPCLELMSCFGLVTHRCSVSISCFLLSEHVFPRMIFICSSDLVSFWSFLLHLYGGLLSSSP